MNIVSCAGAGRPAPSVTVQGVPGGGGWLLPVVPEQTVFPVSPPPLVPPMPLVCKGQVPLFWGFSVISIYLIPEPPPLSHLRVRG